MTRAYRIFDRPNLRNREEPDETLVPVWDGPEGPDLLDEEGEPRNAPQCVSCGSFTRSGDIPEEPYRAERADGDLPLDLPRRIVCTCCGTSYPTGWARADETIF